MLGDLDFIQKVKFDILFESNIFDTPTVSIFIPTYKRPELLIEAIESAVNQSSVSFPVEIVVVSNDPDGVVDLDAILNIPLITKVCNFKFVVNKENIGMFGNWNRCIQLSNTDWFTILNDDDLLFPGALEGLFQARNKNQFICSYYIQFSKHGDLINFSPKQQKKSISVRLTPLDFMFGHISAGTLGLLINKGCAIEVGGFIPEEYPISDYKFFERYFSQYGGIRLRRTTSAYRWAVNESMKPETIYGFIREDYLFWHQLAGKYYSGKKFTILLMRILSRYLTIKKIGKYSSLSAQVNSVDMLKSLPFSIYKSERFAYQCLPHYVVRAFFVLMKKFNLIN